MFDLNKICAWVSSLALTGCGAGGALAVVGSAGGTLVTPHMEAPIAAGVNVLYCSTFQIAWNDMRDGIVGENIRLEKPLVLVDRLNRSPVTEADIAEEDYVAMVGVGTGAFVDDLNRALRLKFGGDVPRLGDGYKNPATIIAYAFLKKNLEFERPFDVLENPIRFHGNGGASLVEGFGIGNFSRERHAKIRDQVEIVDYNGVGDFVIRLRSMQPGEDIVVASVRPRETLLETFEMVDARVASSMNARMSENDVLMVPMLDVSVRHSYESLLDLYLLNAGFEEYFIQEAAQDIRFRMNQRGAGVDSEAKFVIEMKGPSPDHKLLVCYKPFMLYLKRKNAKYPYFAVWVANPEMMVSNG